MNLGWLNQMIIYKVLRGMIDNENNGWGGVCNERWRYSRRDKIRGTEGCKKYKGKGKERRGEESKTEIWTI